MSFKIDTTLVSDLANLKSEVQKVKTDMDNLVAGVVDTTAIYEAINTKQNIGDYATNISVDNKISNIDFTPYATTEYVNQKLQQKQNTGDYALNTEIAEIYATKQDLSLITDVDFDNLITVNQLQNDLNGLEQTIKADIASAYATKEDLNNIDIDSSDIDLTDYATKEFVNNSLSNKLTLIDNEIPETYLQNYAKTTDLTNYVTTNILEDYATKSQVTSSLVNKVSTVNGKIPENLLPENFASNILDTYVQTFVVENNTTDTITLDRPITSKYHIVINVSNIIAQYSTFELQDATTIKFNSYLPYSSEVDNRIILEIVYLKYYTGIINDVSTLANKYYQRIFENVSVNDTKTISILDIKKPTEVLKYLSKENSPTIIDNTIDISTENFTGTNIIFLKYGATINNAAEDNLLISNDIMLSTAVINKIFTTSQNNSEVKILLSNDSGTNWKTYDFNNNTYVQEDLNNIKTSGISSNRIYDINTFDIFTDKIKIACYLTSNTLLNSITLNVTQQCEYEQTAPGAEIVYTKGDNQLKIKFKSAGTYLVNY